MSANTIEVNRSRGNIRPGEPLWIFGYGSLIFKADFPFLERRAAAITGWERRFWQGSHDHRGTHDAPGRVVTLVPSPDTRCTGMAYLIDHQTLDHLDYREKNGYLRFDTELLFSDQESATGLVYIATEDNAAWLGPAPEWKISAQIAASSGPSGRNIDYLFALANGIRALGGEDPHVFELERYLKDFGSDFGLE